MAATDVPAAQVPIDRPVLRAAAARRPAALIPMYASLTALHVADFVSTTRALSSGAASEANPMMRPVVGNRAAFLAVKAGSAAGTIWIAERMRKKHPARAVVLMVSTNAVMAAIVAHNLSALSAR
jgi:Domain of unknown function (DUF5658)